MKPANPPTGPYNRYRQEPTPDNLADNRPEILPLLIPGSPLVPLLTARIPTPWRDWLALLRLVERSGGYQSAVAAGLSANSRLYAVLLDCERSLRRVENHSSQRIGIEVTAIDRPQLERHIRSCGLGLLGVLPMGGPAYLAGGVYRQGRPNPPNPSAPDSVNPSDPSKPLPPWHSYARLVDGSNQANPTVAPMGWGDSRISSGFTLAIPFQTRRKE